jgi:hypothetical protein
MAISVKCKLFFTIINITFHWFVVLFKSSALRYSLSKCCYHAITAVELEVSVLAASALASSSPSAPFSTAPAQFALYSPALEAGPQLWSLLLLSLPVLHARALVGELAGAASEYSSAINLLRSKLNLAHIFAKQLDEAASFLFPKLQAQARPSCAGAGILALGHFQRFFRAYYDQVSRKPEQVVQYALTFPSGTSHCAKLTSPNYYFYYYYYYYCYCYYYCFIKTIIGISICLIIIATAIIILQLLLLFLLF